MKTKLYIFALAIFVLFMNEILAHKIAPTSHGSYSSGEKIVNKTIVFTGSGSHDNDSQDGGYTEKWEWAVSADGVIWGSSYMYTTSTFTYTFTTADTFYIRVRFCDNDNQWGAYYTFTIEIIDCKRYYYVKDHLGNIRQTIDENGVIVSAQDYSPYGEVIRSYNNADANDKYKFTEKERDKETNLDYFGARYYDAGIGRWLAVDPLASKYPGWSGYNYTLDNPINSFDPNGEYVVRSSKVVTRVTKEFDQAGNFPLWRFTKSIAKWFVDDPSWYATTSDIFETVSNLGSFFSRQALTNAFMRKYPYESVLPVQGWAQIVDKVFLNAMEYGMRGRSRSYEDEIQDNLTRDENIFKIAAAAGYGWEEGNGTFNVYKNYQSNTFNLFNEIYTFVLKEIEKLNKRESYLTHEEWNKIKDSYLKQIEAEDESKTTIINSGSKKDPHNW